MSGIYIHIPFCKQACNYCNFYFTTNPKKKKEFIITLLEEIKQRSSFLSDNTIETIYFGGGTPSQLDIDDIKLVIDLIGTTFNCSIVEGTIECNPDDLTRKKIEELKTLKPFGINRLSIGIQSFFDEDLTFMKRAHNANEAINAVKFSKEADFKNLTIDLIYGTPHLTNEKWLENLDTAESLGINHLSCYALTVEPKTKLYQDIKQKRLAKLDENKAADQFEMLMKWSSTNGFEQYEISNFAKKGHRAIHNTNYWLGKKYLGLGPSAHSFNGDVRQCNISNIHQYIQKVSSSLPAFEEEVLTASNKVNEFIMTSLRTSWGLDLNKIPATYISQISDTLSKINSDWYKTKDKNITLTDQGKHYADYIASQLFID